MLQMDFDRINKELASGIYEEGPRRAIATSETSKASRVYRVGSRAKRSVPVRAHVKKVAKGSRRKSAN